MLEAMLSHFRSYGMDDLEFIIINSKLSHSQDKLHELQRRVSFEVYQETDEEEVWSVMEGGKDDMFVYDRCGRLTYFIPFPLSILNEYPLVSNAILATYFRSPCGDNCDDNKTIGIDEFVRNMERDYDTANETMQDNSNFMETEQPEYINQTNNETFVSNDLFSVIESVNDDLDILNSNNTNNLTQDYSTYDNSSLTNETQNTRVDKAKSFFSSIYKLFFNNGTDNETLTEVTSNSTLNETSSVGSGRQIMTTNDTNNGVTSHKLHHHNGQHHHHHEENANKPGKTKSDRCLEADYEVCKSWSKNRLLHAQKCCSDVHSNSDRLDPRFCIHFGKKRCKKIQSILKCCIKTVYTETDSVTLTEVSPTAVPTDAPTTAATEFADVVCCKSTENGKLCRVSSFNVCEDGEYIESSTNDPK